MVHRRARPGPGDLGSEGSRPGGDRCGAAGAGGLACPAGAGADPHHRGRTGGCGGERVGCRGVRPPARRWPAGSPASAATCRPPSTDPRGAAAAERVFSEELPYVVVFGRTRRWVRARPQLGASAVHSSWYLSGLPLPLSWLAGQIDQTARSSARLLMARPADSGWRRPVHIATSGWTWDSHHSSSGGFSGGGGSDGGGRRWWRWRLLVTLAAEPAWWRPSCSRWW